VARYSGALAFCKLNIRAPLLVQSQNEFLKQEYLPHLSNGQILLGVGFSHLRRAGDPLIVAVPATGGYQLHVPWVTGFGLFQEFIVAAARMVRRSSV